MRLPFTSPILIINKSAHPKSRLCIARHGAGGFVFSSSSPEGRRKGRIGFNPKKWSLFFALEKQVPVSGIFSFCYFATPPAHGRTVEGAKGDETWAEADVSPRCLVVSGRFGRCLGVFSVARRRVWRPTLGGWLRGAYDSSLVATATIQDVETCNSTHHNATALPRLLLLVCERQSEEEWSAVAWLLHCLSLCFPCSLCRLPMTTQDRPTAPFFRVSGAGAVLATWAGLDLAPMTKPAAMVLATAHRRAPRGKKVEQGGPHWDSRPRQDEEGAEEEGGGGGERQCGSASNPGAAACRLVFRQTRKWREKEAYAPVSE